MKDDRTRCLDAGMDDYIAKPIRTQILLDTIDAVLRQDRLPAAGADEEVDVPSPIDWDIALNFVQGDQGLLKDIAEAFLGECNLHLETVENGLESKDYASLQRGAHTLKGNLRYFGAHVAMEAALGLEVMGREKNASGGPELLDRLQKQLDRIVPVLQGFVASGEFA
jgi:two-component system sensor histidine kinase/response regulator